MLGHQNVIGNKESNKVVIYVDKGRSTSSQAELNPSRYKLLPEGKSLSFLSPIYLHKVQNTGDYYLMRLLQDFYILILFNCHCPKDGQVIDVEVKVKL